MTDGVFDALFDLTRLRRYITVGFIGSAVDLSISVPLVLVTDIAPELAKFLGAEAAIIVMFYVNDRWTFGALDTLDGMHRLRRLVKSNLVRAGGLVVQVTVVYLLTRSTIVLYAGGTDVWPALTMPIAMACGFVVNYTGENLITWRTHT